MTNNPNRDRIFDTAIAALKKTKTEGGQFILLHLDQKDSDTDMLAASSFVEPRSMEVFHRALDMISNTYTAALSTKGETMQ